MRSLTEFAELAGAMQTVEQVAVLLELGEMTAEERRSLAALLRSGAPRPWLVALSVASLEEPDLAAWSEGGVDWIVGPDEPAFQIARHLAKLQDAHFAQTENAFLRALVEASPHGMTVVDMRQHDQPLVFVNAAFTTVTGYSREESIGRNCRFLQSGLLAQPATDEIRRALAAGEPTHVKLYNRRKEGALFVNELILAPFRDGRDRTTHFIGVQRDVTLRESAMQRLEASPFKVWQMDELLRTEFINAAWTDVVVDPNVLPPPDMLQFVDPADRGKVREALERSLRMGRTSGVEARLRLLSGEPRWHHFSVNPRVADDGQVFGLIGAALDISSNRALEERSERRLQQLSLQSLLMRRLLGGAIVDSAAAGQAVEIVAEILGADEIALAALAGGDGALQLRRHWALQEGSALPGAISGRRFKEVFPFSAAAVLEAEGAIGLEASECRRFAAAGGMLAFALRREGRVIGCLFATAGAPASDWERVASEQLKAVGNLLHFAL
ncbi:MAG: PAS domain S-box protein [Verrucomicrobia bacterium]|nr:PAS domain S-box protein [Verrucomicrobiota bacterium]